MMKKFCQWLQKNEILVLLLSLTALLRVPTLLEPNRYADEDIYLVLGQAIRKGLVLYRDIHDNKPPMIYLLAAAAGSVTGFRLILAVWNLVNVGLFWVLSRKLLKKTWSVGLASLFFVIMSNIPLWEGNIANGEIFMIMPVVAAVWLLLSNKPLSSSPLGRGEYTRYLLAGFLMAAGFLFKVPVAFDFLGVVIWLVVYQANDIWKMARGLVDRRLWLMVLGLLAPVAVSLGYFWLMGAGEEFVQAALGENLGYLSSWEGGRQPLYMSGLFQRVVVAVLVMGGVVGLRKWLGRRWGLVALWFTWALFGANLAGRPYPHYLLQVVPAGSLLLGLITEEVVGREKKKMLIRIGMGLGLLLLMGLAMWRYDFWSYKSLPYYQNFLEVIGGRKSWQEYKDFFGEGVRRNEGVARYIKERTRPEERIFVWGTEPAIYFLSERVPVGKYTVSYHVVDLNGFEKVMEEIEKEAPKYIVWMENETYDFIELWELLGKEYMEVEQIGEARIFRRI